MRSRFASCSLTAVERNNPDGSGVGRGVGANLNKAVVTATPSRRARQVFTVAAVGVALVTFGALAWYQSQPTGGLVASVAEPVEPVRTPSIDLPVAPPQGPKTIAKKPTTADRLVSQAEAHLVRAEYAEYFALMRALGKGPRGYYLRGLLAEELGADYAAREGYFDAKGYAPAKQRLAQLGKDPDVSGDDDDVDPLTVQLANRPADITLDLPKPACARTQASGFAAYCRCLGMAAMVTRRSHWGTAAIDDVAKQDYARKRACRRRGSTPVYAVGVDNGIHPLEHVVIDRRSSPVRVVVALTNNSTMFGDHRDGRVRRVRRRSVGNKRYHWIELAHETGTCPFKPQCETNKVRAVVVCGRDKVSGLLRCSRQLPVFHERDTGILFEAPRNAPEISRFRFKLSLRANDKVLIRRVGRRKDPTPRRLGLQPLFAP